MADHGFEADGNGAARRGPGLSPDAGAGQPARPRRARWPWVVAGAAAIGALALVATPWVGAQLRTAMPAALPPADVPAPDPRLAALEGRVRALELAAGAAEPGPADLAPAPSVDAALESRLAALEARATALQSTDGAVDSRLGQMALEVARVSGLAAAGDRQVRDLFLLAVARRLVEQGQPLGRVELLLAERFQATDTPAIEALGAWSRVPQTRATLAARLETLARNDGPAAAAGGDWWARLKARLSGLVTVRGNGAAAASPDPGALPAARQALAAGDLEAALARMAQASASPARDQWLLDARVLLAAEAALDRLEGALLAEAAATLPPVQPPVNAAPVPAP
jgi:hypothetical protein